MGHLTAVPPVLWGKGHLHLNREPEFFGGKHGKIFVTVQHSLVVGFY